TAGQLRLQRLGDSFSNLALDAKDVSQLPVVGVGPEMGIGLRVNQLHIDPHLIGRFLDAALKDVRYTKLLRGFAEIPWFALIALRGSVRNYFQICDLSQPRQDFLLNAVRKIGVIRIATEVFKGQHGDAFLGWWARRQPSLPIEWKRQRESSC